MAMMLITVVLFQVNVSALIEISRSAGIRLATEKIHSVIRPLMAISSHSPRNILKAMARPYILL